MKRAVILLFVISILLAIATLPISATSDTAGLYSTVVDRDGNLTSGEEKQILESLRSAEIATDAIFVVAIYDIWGGIPSGESIVGKLGLDIYTDSIVLLVIENGGYSTNYYEMFTWGAANDLISDSAVNEILDHPDVYSNIKGGRFTLGALAFTDETVRAVKSFRRGVLLGIIAFSLLAGAISVVIVIISYKRKLKAPIYPLSDYADYKLGNCSDTFLGKSVTRVKIESSSGGSGGGRSSSGGSRGRR